MSRKESLYQGIEAAQAGNRIGDIGAGGPGLWWSKTVLVSSASMSVMASADNLHEDPEVPNFGSPGRGVRLVAGMTIAIEPMINRRGEDVKRFRMILDGVTSSGSLSAHFEHTVAITDKGR